MTKKSNLRSILLIEGPDKAGKSTLTEAIIKAFPGIMFKITDRPNDGTTQERDKIKRYYNSVTTFMIKNPTLNILMDRFFPSEIVYSQPKRGYEGMEDSDLWAIDRFLADYGTVLIYCDPGHDEIQKRLEKLGDDYVSKDDTAELLSRYERFLKTTDMRVIRVDTKKPVEEILKEIKIQLI